MTNAVLAVVVDAVLEAHLNDLHPPHEGCGLRQPSLTNELIWCGNRKPALSELNRGE